ncbi:methyltransferase domain-containing protein [Flavobacterium sp.]|uniref:methyltransferase domain-containing protein n=1 Tax=Flavobacterium sp. TaxID=239 RepID=UPI0037533045
MDIKEISSCVDQNTHWYYQSKKLPLLNYFKKLPCSIKYDIIDVGSGSGFFAKEILNTFPDKINICYLIDTEYTEEEINNSLNTQLVKQNTIPNSISNSLIILMDVLEHLEDDIQMLTDIKNNAIGNNNYFFITVPAFQSLWSAHDEYLCHYRRYTITSLKKLFLKSQFTLQSIYYLYGTLFPLVWISRKISNLFPPKEFTSEMKPVHPLLNKILLFISSFDANYINKNKLAGVSCVAFGKIDK